MKLLRMNRGVSMLERLRNQRVVITGAGSGIGRHLALRFASAGARVAVADRNRESAHAVVEQIGGTALAVEMDVTQEDSVAAGMAAVIDGFGGIDVLIANAGIQTISPFEKFDFNAWRALLQVHLDGAFLTSRAMFRHLLESERSGSILVMGSIHSHVGARFKAAYVTAKHGLAGLVRSLAVEGGPHGIRSYLICPGFVDTPLVRKQIPEQAAELGISEDEVVQRVMLGNTVDGQFTTLDEVAETALFLSAFPTNALTGQSIVVSHGADMH